MKENSKPAQLQALRTEQEKTAVAIEYVPGEAAPKILATGKGAPLSSSSMGFLAFSAISRRIKGEHIPLSIKV